MTQTTIICGAPGSGKTTYAKSQMTDGDLIVDHDLLYKALTGLDYYNKPIELFPYVQAAYSAVIDELEHRDDIYRAWVIACLPNGDDRDILACRLNARVILIEALEFACINRIEKDARRSEHARTWEKIIRKWFRDYTPREGDVVLKLQEESMLDLGMTRLG